MLSVGVNRKQADGRCYSNGLRVSGHETKQNDGLWTSGHRRARDLIGGASVHATPGS